jgi:hypothetical protein
MDILPSNFEFWIYIVIACVIGIFTGLLIGKRRKDESKASPNYYDIEYNIECEIAGLIEKTPLEMLTNKGTRIILYKYSTSDITDQFCVCFSSTKKFSPGNELAEVFFHTLEGYERFIELRCQKQPDTKLYVDILAMESTRTLFKQAGLPQGALRENSQRPQCSSKERG